MLYTIDDIINEAEKIFQMADFVDKVAITCKGDLGGEIECYRDGGYYIDVQKPPQKNSEKSVALCKLRDQDRCSMYCEGFDTSCEEYRPVKKDGE